MNPEAFQRPSTISKMELFAEKLFLKKAPSWTFNCSKYISRSVNYFCKKLRLRCFTGFEIHL